MTILVLGTGCKKCKQLERNAIEAVHASGVEAEVKKVEDVATIMRYGVMNTPALVIDEQVVATGRLLSIAEIEALLK